MLTEQELCAIENRIDEIYVTSGQQINPAVTMLRLVLDAYRALTADYLFLHASITSFGVSEREARDKFKAYADQLKAYNKQLEAFRATHLSRKEPS